MKLLKFSCGLRKLHHISSRKRFPARNHFNSQVVIAIIAFMVAITRSVSFSCPYCTLKDPTLTEQLAEADAACIVKFLESKNGEELSMQETTFQIVQLIKTSKPSMAYRPDDKIVVTFGQVANRGDKFLLMGQEKGGLMEWSLPVVIDEISQEYVRQAPSPESPSKAKRLKYFLKFLDYSDPVVSNDAFLEFAKADFVTIDEMIRGLTPREKETLRVKLRTWLDDDDTRLDVRRASYGNMLGLCGDESDAKYLEAKILAPVDPSKNRLGIDGIMGGYLLLTGEDGLRSLIAHVFDSPPTEASDADLNSLRMTISVLWDYRKSQFSKESLCAAMRRYLERSNTAELAIIDLARWKDWTPLKQLTDAYGADPWDHRAAKEKIVAYVLCYLKDASRDQELKSKEGVIEAEAFLGKVEPQIVESAKQSLGFNSSVKSSDR